jgi:hypothetical protein
MTETLIAVLIGIMFVVSLLMYTFDPWLGCALGILTAIAGSIAALKAAPSLPADRRHEKRKMNWDEEEPPE